METREAREALAEGWWKNDVAGEEDEGVLRRSRKEEREEMLPGLRSLSKREEERSEASSG